MMKKIPHFLKKKNESKSSNTSRVTNDTIAEHREKVIAEGRRFKYPVQYTKNKLVFNAIIVGVVALVLFILFCWWELFKVQSTSDFFYKLTQIVPVPVAKVDGKFVKYGDYLMNYHPSKVYLDTIENANDSDSSSSEDASKYHYYKIQAMDKAVEDTFASKLADSMGISVSKSEVDKAIDSSLHGSSGSKISKNVRNRSLERIYDISPSEARHFIRKSLLRQKVAYAIDSDAGKTKDMISDILKKDPEAKFDKIIADNNDSFPVNAQVLESGWVSKGNHDGGIARAASKLESGEFTGPIKPTDGNGYCFVRLLGVNESGEVNYKLIRVPLSEFSDRVDKLNKNNKIKYYIDLKGINSKNNQ